jgi:hypothetical protein
MGNHEIQFTASVSLAIGHYEGHGLFLTLYESTSDCALTFGRALSDASILLLLRSSANSARCARSVVVMRFTSTGYNADEAVGFDVDGITADALRSSTNFVEKIRYIFLFYGNLEDTPIVEPRPNHHP